VTGWTDLRIGDPADDIAWLVGSNEPRFIDAVLAAYHEARKEPVDPQLARRAALAAEFALAQYLVKALALDDREVARDAEAMLAELAADIEASEAADAAESAAVPLRDGGSGDAPTAPDSDVPAPRAPAPTGQDSDGRASGGRAPEGRAPEGRAPEGRAPEERRPAAEGARAVDPAPATDAIPLITDGRGEG
jgi:hypothetical protein